MEARRKSEVIVSPCGKFRERVFKGQRYMVIAQMDEHSKPLVTCFNTREQAERVDESCYRLGYEAHYIVQAEVVK